ncbi:MAG TPA: IS1380 family transposase, partial [Terriglobales bacterium]
RIVKQIRAAWPEVKIVLRGDSGFCRNELMSWCENNGVDFLFGMARNKRLRRIIGQQMHEATVQWNRTGKPSRVFSEFAYSTRKTKKGGWNRERRVVAKAEHIDGKENPRFVVTSLTGERWAAQPLYEDLYCERGDMENRIKEQFSLFADRVSAETIRANQMRLYLSAAAYILVSGLRRVGLKGTELAQAQVSTIRAKVLKIGAQIRVSVRKVWVSMASSYPWQGLYRQVWSNLRC